jgi:hypothetical protein
MLSKVDAVPKRLGSQRGMRKYEVIAARGERRPVVVRVGEHHHVIALAFLNQQVIDSLTTRTANIGQNPGIILFNPR